MPATIAKDKEFLALVNSGAIEADRADFKMPDSVVKVGSEYYKKGHIPKDTPENKLAAPSGLTVSYNESSQTITLRWGAVGRVADDESYGEFGYKIYKDGVYVGWTTGTSYTMSTSSPSGSYRVEAAYKGYSGIEAASATNNFTFKHQNTPEEDCAEQGGTWDGSTCTINQPEPSPSDSPEPETPNNP